MPSEGRDSDFRRVLYGMVFEWHVSRATGGSGVVEALLYNAGRRGREVPKGEGTPEQNVCDDDSGCAGDGFLGAQRNVTDAIAGSRGE